MYNFCFCFDNFFNPLLIHGVWRNFALIWKSYKGERFRIAQKILQKMFRILNLFLGTDLLSSN